MNITQHKEKEASLKEMTEVLSKLKELRTGERYDNSYLVGLFVESQKIILTHMVSELQTKLTEAHDNN